MSSVNIGLGEVTIDPKHLWTFLEYLKANFVFSDPVKYSSKVYQSELSDCESQQDGFQSPGLYL